MQFFGINIRKCKGVYSPSDDTLLLAKAVLSYLQEGEHFLEIGVGTGLIAILAAKNGARVTGTDLEEKALDCTKKNAELNQVELNLKKSDLFANIERKFKIVAFNAPYLPASNFDRFLTSSMNHALVGGETGNEISLRFIREVDKYLARGGLSFLVTSSRGRSKEVTEKAEEYGLKVTEEEQKHFFFEELIVLKLEKKK